MSRQALSSQIWRPPRASTARTRFTSLLFILSCAAGSALAKSEPAWNGQVAPGSDTTQRDKVDFLPYWVPYGAKSVDDTDPSIRYSSGSDNSGSSILLGTLSDSSSDGGSDWQVQASHEYIDGTTHSTSTPGATLTYEFHGSGIDWYGSRGPHHGSAGVWVDGLRTQDVMLYAHTEQFQQLLVHIDQLANVKHTIVIKVLEASESQAGGDIVDIDAFVVQTLSSSKQNARSTSNTHTSHDTRMQRQPRHHLSQHDKRDVWDQQTLMIETGNSGVNAMQLAVVDDHRAIIIDKVEHNLLTVKGHPAWGAIYDFTSPAPANLRALDLQSNSFCAGGSWLSNGTLINVGGNPVVHDHTGSADFGDVNGLQAVRLFTPCDDGNCDIYENPKRVRMASPRWYATLARLADGSAFILGGSKKGGWINNATQNNPTLEYYPPKAIHNSKGMPIRSPFLEQTLNSNLFPIVFQLPDDKLFVAANRDAMIYDWKTNKERRLAKFPNGVRVTYPMTAGSVLLPLTPENNYTPEVLICGGSSGDDKRASWNIDSSEPASDQCVRMVLNEQGIAKGWQVEKMPQARIMPDLILLPNGDVLIVNGAQTGVAGYGNVKNQVGESNAANPTFTPVVYRPSAPKGQRFITSGMPTSHIARMYHSVATLLPNGEILVAGSNPNLDRTEMEYQTEYRVETISPAYMRQLRPTYLNPPKNILYGQDFNLKAVLPLNTPVVDIEVVLMDLGFVTHSVHMNSRLVKLKVKESNNLRNMVIEGPPNANIYPPGPAWLYLVVKGVPSQGRKVMIGDGRGPPVDEAAIRYVLEHTKPLA